MLVDTTPDLDVLPCDKASEMSHYVHVLFYVISFYNSNDSTVENSLNIVMVYLIALSA